MISVFVEGKLINLETLSDREERTMTEGTIDQVQFEAILNKRRAEAFRGVLVKVVCPVCGKMIHFVTTLAGRKMPCEFELRRGDGVRTLVTHYGQTIRKAGEEVYGYEPHFGNCRKAVV
jgi:hypothetical protein